MTTSEGDVLFREMDVTFYTDGTAIQRIYNFHVLGSWKLSENEILLTNVNTHNFSVNFWNDFKRAIITYEITKDVPSK